MLSSSSFTSSSRACVSSRGTGMRTAPARSRIALPARSRTSHLPATWMDEAIAKANANVNLKKGKDSKKMSGFRYDGSMMRWVRRVHGCHCVAPMHPCVCMGPPLSMRMHDPPTLHHNIRIHGPPTLLLERDPSTCQSASWRRCAGPRGPRPYSNPLTVESRSSSSSYELFLMKLSEHQATW
jgi:hypothetical protein